MLVRIKKGKGERRWVSGMIMSTQPRTSCSHLHTQNFCGLFSWRQARFSVPILSLSSAKNPINEMLALWYSLRFWMKNLAHMSSQLIILKLAILLVTLKRTSNSLRWVKFKSKWAEHQPARSDQNFFTVWHVMKKWDMESTSVQKEHWSDVLIFSVCRCLLHGVRRYTSL